MAIARRLERYLDERGVHYALIPHHRTESSRQTATAAHVDPARLAKSVLLEDDQGYLLAVLPASRRLDLEALRRELGRRLVLATEAEVEDIFEDCGPGAAPPLGAAYGIPTALDERLLHLTDVYFEAGDHQNLAHVTGADFAALFRGAPHAEFSRDTGDDGVEHAVRARSERRHRLDEELVHVFSLRAYGAGLRRQPEYDKDGHTGMILMKTPELRVVLEAVRAGTRLATHVVHGPATLLLLEGALDVRTERGSFRVGEGEMVVLPRDERRAIHAPAPSLFLIVLSPMQPARLEPVAPPPPSPTPEARTAPWRVLIVANRTVGGSHLIEEVQQRMQEGPCEFVVLCPASPASSNLVWEEHAVREEANARLHNACERLRKLGARVSGYVGDFYPLTAIRDLLLVQEFDEIIVSTLPQGISEWLRMDLPSRVERRFGIPVTHIVSRE